MVFIVTSNFKVTVLINQSALIFTLPNRIGNLKGSLFVIEGEKKTTELIWNHSSALLLLWGLLVLFWMCCLLTATVKRLPERTRGCAIYRSAGRFKYNSRVLVADGWTSELRWKQQQLTQEDHIHCTPPSVPWSAFSSCSRSLLELAVLLASSPAVTLANKGWGA